MIGRRLSHFYVLRSLGRGGMGVVYEAQDLRLPRSVAIKVLKPALARDADAMRRFRREARLAASLNHPNICTIFEVEDEGAQPFIVMELLQGRTLKSLIGQRPLAEAELLELGVQVAAALGTAHDHGIMHRDVTPGNVFMTVDGRIKVLDFGLAKQYRSLDDDTLLTDDVTRTGEAPGTVHYMAPEQFEPDAAVDHRCDLYSLGAVLYQAATGSRPFEAATRNELVAAIREQAPTPLRQLAPHVSPGLAVVVERLLERVPTLRYQSAWNLHADLDVLRSGPTADAGPRSKAANSRVVLAVLPFQPLGVQTAVSEQFRQGLAEDVAHGLAGLGGVTVLPGTTTRHRSDAPSAADLRELHVDLGVEATVQQLPAQLRVIASLFRVAGEGDVVSSVRLDRSTDDLLGSQRDAAGEIVRAFAAPLKAAAGGTPRRMEAENAFRRGLYHWKQCFSGGWEQALQQYKIAIEQEPDFVEAHVAEAAVYNFLGYYCVMRPKLAFQVARQASLRALDVDDTSAPAHLEYALATLGGDWAWDEAEESFRRALAIAPDHALAHTYYAWLLVLLGRDDVAISEAEAGLSLAPQSRLTASGLAQTLYLARRYHDAVAVCDACLDRDDAYVFAVHLRGQCRQMLGDFDRAAHDMERAAMLTGRTPFYLALLGHCYGVGRRHADAEQLLQQFQAMEAAAQYVPPHCYVYTLAGLGRPEEALAHQERAYEDGASPFNYLTPNIRGLFALEPGQRDRLRQMRLAL